MDVSTSQKHLLYQHLLYLYLSISTHLVKILVLQTTCNDCIALFRK